MQSSDFQLLYTKTKPAKSLDILETILSKSDVISLCQLLDINEKELTFTTMRNAFRRICLRHHPQLILYHLQEKPQEGTTTRYYDQFQQAVGAFAKLAAMIVMQDTNALHGKRRSAFDWAGRMTCINADIQASHAYGRSLRPTEPEDIFPTLQSIQEVMQGTSVGSSWRCLDRATKMLDVFISHAEQVGNHTVYVITVIYSMRCHRVKRRYSEFLALHELLSRMVDILPSFPPKKWSKNSAVVLSERASALSLYLQGVATALANKNMFSKELHEFLNINTLRVRREEELRIITLLDQNKEGADKTDRWYIVDEQWLRQWRAFVQPNADFDPPGRITNDRLLHADGLPRSNMGIITDYRFVNADVWAFWTSIYGGGPAIIRGTKDLYSKPVLGYRSSLLCIQRAVRRFLDQRRASKTQNTIGYVLAMQKRKQRQSQKRLIAACIIQKAMRQWIAKAKECRTAVGA